MTRTGLRTVGTTGLEVTPLTIGGAPLGSMPKNFGYEVSAESGIATARAALTGAVRALDTSAAYSGGESERRIGAALAQIGGLPDGYLLSTKISRDLDTGDFSGEQMRRSIAGSLERLGLRRVPLVYLHDPENTTFEEAVRPGGAVEVLRELKESGVAHAIGVAGGETSVISRYVATGIFDVLLTHNRWTLVNRNADRLIDQACDLGMGVVNAAVFGGGILASGTRSSARYGYRDAPEELLEAIRRIEALCSEADVPLASLAVQFSVRDPRIASTVVGVSRPERIEQNVAAATATIPDEIYDEVDLIVSSLPSTLGPQ
ncbi:aldo/keto reductase [Streptomyces niveus]|uniref:aldo/keto reductase n=1 Tax=Streptomyces niveus TaxID=193462 RepID=UPI0036387E29